MIGAGRVSKAGQPRKAHRAPFCQRRLVRRGERNESQHDHNRQPIDNAQMNGKVFVMGLVGGCIVLVVSFQLLNQFT